MVVKGPPVYRTEEQILQKACAETSPEMKVVFMQAAIRISICEFHGAGMSIPDERQKLQERKNRNSNRTKLSPPPSLIRHLYAGKKPPRE
jgi:hypothetical protein